MYLPSFKRKLTTVYLRREKEKDALDNCLMKAKQAEMPLKRNLCHQFVRKIIFNGNWQWLERGREEERKRVRGFLLLTPTTSYLQLIN